MLEAVVYGALRFIEEYEQEGGIGPGLETSYNEFREAFDKEYNKRIVPPPASEVTAVH